EDESRYVVEPRRSITETARWGIVPLDGEVPDRDAATTGTVSVRPSGISTRQGDAVDSVGGLGERRAVSFDGDSIGQDNRRLDGVRRARSEVENAAPCIRRGGVQSRRVIRDAVAYRAVVHGVHTGRLHADLVRGGHEAAMLRGRVDQILRVARVAFRQ